MATATGTEIMRHMLKLKYVILLSKNNTFVKLLYMDQYEEMKQKFFAWLKVVARNDEVIILKSTLYNTTYLKHKLKEVLGI